MQLKDLEKIDLEKLKNGKTSEEVFGISEQPKMCCPIIDSVIEEVATAASNISHHNAQYDSLDECQTALEGTHDIAIWLDVKDEMEKLRKQVEDIRSWGQEWKDLSKELFKKYGSIDDTAIDQ